MIDIAELLKPWHALPIAVVDFETTGVDPAECWPVEIAIVRFEHGQPVGRWSSLLNIGNAPIPAEASAVHGITPDMLEGAPDVGMLASIVDVQAGALLNGALPCAYNEGYDRAIFHRFVKCAPGALVHRRDWPWIDPLTMVRYFDRFVKGSGRHRLQKTCERRGVPMPAAHRALGDAEACGLLLWSMREEVGDITTGELLRKQQIRAAEQERDFQEWLAKQPPLEGAQSPA